MKREIKFRAWDLDAKDRLYSWEEIRNTFYEHLINDRVIVMQYTGLKDKKGVEIYEGDIVRWTFGRHYWEAVIQTVPNNKSSTLYAIETYHNCTSDELEEKYTYQRSNSRSGVRNDIEYLSKEVEIIGNINQNKELLNH